MSKRILFISDLHLQESRSDITRTLLQFLDINSGKCAALYILGDLFEDWIGDDEQSPLIDEITSALRGFHVAGSSIYLMHGNRDFLIGDNFAKRCGAELIEDPCILKTEAGHIVLLHGDTLCTDDLEYMQFRAQVRQQVWQQEFLAKPSMIAGPSLKRLAKRAKKLLLPKITRLWMLMDKRFWIYSISFRKT